MKKLKIVMFGPSLEEKGGMGTVSTLIMKKASKSIEIRHLSTWNGKHQDLASRFNIFLQALIAFFGELIKGKVDLVHLHISENGSVFRNSILILIALAFRKPIILHTHGAEFHLFHRKLPKIIRQGVNWILQQCTYVIVLSESWKQFYLKNCHLTKEQVILLYNPVMIPPQIPDRSSSHLNFVFLGKINQRKGIYDLLQAFAYLPIQYQDQVQLILAGTGEEEQARHLAKTLGIDQNVQFIGWIDQKQRDDLLAKAHVFFLPSYQEGLPMALLEAMSWELPCITTPVGGIPEVIINEKTGLLVNPGDVQQLAIAMQTLIENEPLRLRLGKASRERVKPHDINNYCVSLFDLYYASLRKPQENLSIFQENLSGQNKS